MEDYFLLLKANVPIYMVSVQSHSIVSCKDKKEQYACMRSLVFTHDSEDCVSLRRHAPGLKITRHGTVTCAEQLLD